MATISFEFPDTQEQAETISAWKRAAKDLGHSAKVSNGANPFGVKFLEVEGDFDADAIEGDIITQVWINSP
jgi:hypothetical protein